LLVWAAADQTKTAEANIAKAKRTCEK